MRRPGTAVGVLGLVAPLAAVALSIGACGATSQSSSSPSQVQQDCTTVSVVLANGPDPDADSVGYAQAQVLPLRRLHVSDPALTKAIAALDSAYRRYSTGGGSGGTAVAVAAAQNAVNAICPGAAQ